MYIDPKKVLWTSLDLESQIVQFGIIAIGSSEEPSKVLIYRFFLEPSGSSARSAYGSWKNPISYQGFLKELMYVRLLYLSRPLFAPPSCS